MNKKITSFLLSALCMIGISQAQYVEDGLLFSQPELGSTARFKAMGNANTSLGGDLSSITSNPAGLGFFNTSDAGLSFDYLNMQSKSSYYGTSTTGSKEKFSLSQAGAVFHMPVRSRVSRNTGWLNFNIGIGYAKTNDFNSTIDFIGENNTSSYTNFLAEAANDASYDPVFGDWGFKSYLLDFHEGQGFYYPAASESVTNSQGNLDKRTGNQFQTNIAFGANYSNKFYVGASIGIAGFSYTKDRRFDEIGFMKDENEIRAINPNSDFLDPSHEAYDFVYADYELSSSGIQKTNGTGFNGTLGVIYKPDNMFQIGFSATSPTWYTVTDDYSMYFDSWMVDPETNEAFFEYASNEELYYDEYKLRTPYRLNAGVSALFTEGLISADVEYIDYASMRVTTDYADVNAASDEDINNLYQSAVNFRLGGEYRLAPDFLLRAGYNYRGNPYKEGLASTAQTISGGLGYRINNTYIDLTYLNHRYDMEYTPYQSIDYPPNTASIENSRNNVFLTVGFKF
ncbi:OmpP1/FadL family transporter [Albibacterium indicum]|uniref:OmpP1/FadL family transporter n=1 Tax=Albibacterium indicum TaxID=2292082 RepID=UPI000E53AB96|nr:outer membrane protein transport protein [Pedobacter indicus]